MSLSLGVLSAALEIQDKFSEAAEKFEKKSSTIVDKLSAIEGAVGALAVGEVFEKLASGAEMVAEAIIAPTEKMIEFGREIQNTSNRTGIAVDQLQVLRVAAEESGTSLEAVTAATARFQAKLGDGSQKTIEAVAKLGLSLQTLRNEDPGKALEDTLQALSKIPNAADRAQTGMALLGRGFMALLPMGAKIDEIRQKMEEFGLIMSADVVANAKAAGDEIGFLSEVVSATERNFGTAVTQSAAFHDAIKLLTNIVGQLSKWVQDNRAYLQSWVDTGIAFAARAIGALISVLGGVLAALHFLYDYWLVFNGAIELMTVDIKLAVDLFKAMVDHSPTEATAAWTRSVKDADAIVVKYNKSLAESDAHYKTADQGLSKTMNSLFDFANHVDATNGKVNTLGESMKKNQPSSGETSGMKAAVDAYNKLEDKIAALNTKYETAGSATSEYAKHQAEVTAQATQLQNEISDLQVKFPQLADALDKTGLHVMTLTKAWHDEVEAAERIKEQEAATQKLQQATDEYDKALFALNPTTDLQNKLLSDQTKLKDQEIDKWLKANPLMADAAAKMHELNHATAELVAEKQGIDSFIASLNAIGSALDSLGAKSLGGIFSSGGGLFKSLTGVGGISGLFSDVKDAFSGDGVLGIAKSFIGNFASVLPVAGAAVGFAKSVVGFIGGIFGSQPEYEKIATQLGNSLGAKISEATAKSIESTESTDKVSRGVSELLNLDKVEKDVGSFSSGIQKMVGDLLTGIAQGSVPAKQGMDELDKLFSQANSDAQKAGTTFDTVTISMVTQARALGELTPAMQQYIDQAHQLEEAGAAGIAKGLGEFKFDLSKTGGLSSTDQSLAGQWGTDAARFFVAGFSEMISSKGLVSALESEKTDFEAMWKNLGDAGNTAAQQVLAPFEALDVAINGTDSSLKGMVTTLEGEDKVFQGLGKTGLMTTDSFQAFERSISSTNDSLKAAGVDGKTSLMAIHQELQDAIDASRAFGIPLDANTQKLIDQSKAAGIAFKTDPIDALTTAINNLTLALGGTIDKVGSLGSAVSGLPAALPSYVSTPDGVSYGPPATPAGGYSASNHPTGPPAGTIPNFKQGTAGFVDFGTETLVALHGVEAIVPKTASFSGGAIAGSNGGSSTGSAAQLLEEIRGMRNDMNSRLPTAVSRATRDAFTRVGALKK